jgi:hypothetical protein
MSLSTAYQFDFVDEKLFYYRMGHAGQMSKNMEERYRCADRIVNNFLKKHPGLISASTIRKASAFTCCGRGEYYRTRDRKKSTFYFLSAIRHNPAELGAYKGLIKNAVTW